MMASRPDCQCIVYLPCLRKVIDKYEILRTTIVNDNDSILQKIAQSVSCNQVLLKDQFTSRPDSTFLKEIRARMVRCQTFLCICQDFPVCTQTRMKLHSRGAIETEIKKFIVQRLQKKTLPVSYMVLSCNWNLAVFNVADIGLTFT